MKQLDNPRQTHWRELEWIACVLFCLALLWYGVMWLVPLSEGLKKVSSPVLQTHLLAHQSYETVGGTKEIPLDYYTIISFDEAQARVPSSTWAYGQLLLLAVMLSVWLALSTYLRRFWCLLSLAMFAALCYSMSLDQLRLFGRVDLLPYGLVVLGAVLMAWHIQRKGSHLLMGRRITIFASYIALIAIGIHYFSEESSPFLVLSHHTYYAQICITMLFALFVGHEIPYLLLRMSSAAGFGRSGPQFVLIFLLYLAHLLLFFLNNTGYIDWDIDYVNEFVFLGISAIVGVWGLRERSHQFEYLLPYRLLSVNYFLLGAFSFCSLVYLRWEGNDPAVEVVEDTILFGHLGFGIGFFVYVLMNFWKPLFSNIDVWKRVYEEVETPFLIVRLFGLVGIFVCYSLSQKAAQYHLLSGEQMHLATLHSIREENEVAQHYYKQAAAYGYQSHGPNYALAQMAGWRADHHEAASYYRISVSKHPQAEGYLNLGRSLQQIKLEKEAVDAWKEGLAQFSGSTPLCQNLSSYYIQKEQWDSAAYYATRASTPSKASTMAIMAWKAEDWEDIEAPTIASSLALRTNYLAAALRRSELPRLRLDTTVHDRIHGMAYVHNHILSLLRSDPQQAKDSIEALGNLESYPSLLHDLQRLKAFAEQSSGRTDQGLRLLDALGGQDSPYTGFYDYTSGLWSYAAGGYTRAAHYFRSAYTYGYTEALEVGLLSTALLPKTPLREQELGEWRKLSADTTEAWQKYIEEAPFAALDGAKSVVPFLHALERAAHPEPLSLLMLQRLLDEAKFGLATELWEKLSMPQSAPTLYKDCLGAELCLSTKKSDCSEMIKSLSTGVPHLEYLSYLSSPDSIHAHRLLRKAKEFPFQQQLILSASEALSEGGFEILSYELLLSAIETNPYAVPLQKAYALRALALAQERYAVAALLDLKQLLSVDDYADFLKRYLTFKSQLEKQANEW